MSYTVDQITQTIVNQLKLLDPTASAEVGTPERKIIEATAEIIAAAAVDFTQLDNSTDINQMAGSRLDAFLGNFGFGRQQPTFATGIVTFTRANGFTNQIIVPQGTQVIARPSDSPDIIFATVQTGVMNPTDESVDVAVIANTPGSVGNVAANTVVGFGGVNTTVIGITGITNSAAMSGGADGEDDNAYRLRFTNTVFRNLGGTYDHFMALALSSTFVSKVNVIGPISRFQEYIQIPSVLDNRQATTSIISNANGTYSVPGKTTSTGTQAAPGGFPASFNVASTSTFSTAGGSLLVGTAGSNQRLFYDQINSGTQFRITSGWAGSIAASTAVTQATGYDARGTKFPTKATSVVSSIPYSKFTYDQQAYVTDGNLGASATFFKPGVDWVLNREPVSALIKTFQTNTVYNYGDYVIPTAPNGHVYFVGTGGTSGNSEPVWQTGSESATANGTVNFREDGAYYVNARQQDTLNSDLHKPNVTFVNPYDAILNATGTKSLPMGGTVLLEHAFISRNSRNDYFSGILNCVDVFVNGTNPQTVTSAEVVPTSASDLLTNDPTAYNYTGSYQRTLDGSAPNGWDGVSQGTTNRLMPLFWQPVTSVPASIPITDTSGRVNTYYLAQFKAPAYSPTARYSVGDVVRPTTATNDFFQNTYRCTTATPAGVVAGTEPVWGSNVSLNNYITNGNVTPTKFTLIQLASQGSLYFADAAMKKPAHFALVEETTDYYGTIRARNGLEFFRNVPGALSSDVANTPAANAGYTFTGANFNSLPGSDFTVKGYSYDKNIADIQAIVEKQKPVTTDALVHRARYRYFVPYVTVMYTPGSNQSVVNSSIAVALASFFDNAYYGTAIQMSDILQAVHNVPGVDNVRWTIDAPGTTLTYRIQEVQKDSDPLNPVKTFKNDFFIQDSQLAQSPDTAQIVIQVRASNTWLDS